MPRHKPIKFEGLSKSTELKERLKEFINEHPVATSTTKAVLALAALGGILTIGAITPGVVGAFGKSLENRKRAARERYRALWSSFYQLKKSRMITYEGEKDGALVYKLTKKGEVKFRNFMLDTLIIANPAKWDGYWRLIIFDIPEKFSGARKALQRKLAEMGCYQFQKSVWAHPFPCEEEIEFLKDFFNVHQCVFVLLTKDMPHGKVLNYFEDILKKVI